VGTGTKLIFLCVLAFSGFFSPAALAQQRYWVLFKDKPAAAAGQWVSEATAAQRRLQHLPPNQETDAPVHQPYLDSLARRGFTVSSVSKWLNAAVVTAQPGQASTLRQAAYVQEIQPITGYFQAAATAPLQPNYIAKALSQLKSEAIFVQSLTGRGVKIGVIDAGFYEAPQKPGLAPLFESGRIKLYKDFVNPARQDLYGEKESSLDDHGTEVLLCLGGNDPHEKVISGLAPEADYYLARTDHGSRESRVEEEYFVRALEWMDSLGVRLVNSSLGYGTGFDNPAENYRPDQMNGGSFIARAVQMAVEKKGMMLVIAAGNDGGNKKWQILNTPADAPGVITVGATDYFTWVKQGYSGIGPGFLPYLKPDVACFASSGTSFSAPIITGLIACLLEENPRLTPAQLTHILHRSSHLYPFGNNYVGYGVPNAGKALELAHNLSAFPTAVPLEVHGSRFIYKPKSRTNIADNGGIVLFRKESPTLVMAQQKLSSRVKRIVVKRLPGEAYTTVQVGTTVMELVWK
jgi:subtilisin family serine protease